MTFAAGRPLALITRSLAGRDDTGNDAATTVAATLVFGAFAQTTSSEDDGGRDRVVDQPTVYVPPGTVPAPVDAVMVDPALDGAGALVLDGAGNPTGGDLYEVDGQPADWQSPFDGWHPGIEIRLRRVTG